MDYRNATKTVWFIGLSGAGKTTICQGLCKELIKQGLNCQVLDGDTIRERSPDLGFARADRIQHNINIVNMILQNPIDGIYLVATINPFEQSRQYARKHLYPNYFEIHVNTPLEICKSRDPKGLYKKAEEGLVTHMTGIHQEFEPPKSNLKINTHQVSKSEVLKTCYNHILDFYSLSLSLKE